MFLIDGNSTEKFSSAFHHGSLINCHCSWFIYMYGNTLEIWGRRCVVWNRYDHFRELYCFHLQVYCPERSVRNMSKFLPDYTTLRLRRQHSSVKITFRFRGIVCVWHKRGHSLRDCRTGFVVHTEYNSCCSLDGSNNHPVTPYGMESVNLISIPVIQNNKW